MKSDALRTYHESQVCPFRFTRGPYGLLSNFAPTARPILVNALVFHTSEAFYQALKTKDPEHQRIVARAGGPKQAKYHGRVIPLRGDWEGVKVNAMRLTLRVKHAAAKVMVEKELEKTGKKPIVEVSRFDGWWGAKPVGNGSLVGVNVLGRLWQELREEIREGKLRPLEDLGKDFPVNGAIVKMAGPLIEPIPERVASWQR